MTKITRRFRSFAWTVLLAIVPLLGCSREDAPREIPSCKGCNLVLISVDTLRADRLSAYGYERATSPFLETIAGDGFLFEGFYHNGGGTLPSHLTMLTSLSPITHGSNPSNSRPLSPNATTLAEVLLGEGYRTFGITDGGWMEGRFGFDRGFERFHSRANQHLENSLPRFLEWTDAAGSAPFFGFLHTYDVHSNTEGLQYGCPTDGVPRFSDWYDGSFDGCMNGKCSSALLAWLNSESKRSGLDIGETLGPSVVQYLSDRYDECIAYVDQKIEWLVEELKERRLWDRTILVVTSDHGEEFLEHGLMLHEQGGYQELAKIPLIIRVPGSKGRRVQGLSAMIDVLPTLLDLLGLPSLPQAQGMSLVSSMESGNPTGRRFVHMYSVLRTADWLFFRNEEWLYDYRSDAREEVNLYSERPTLVESLRAAVARIIDNDQEHRKRLRRGESESHGPVSLSDEQLENLRSLGYLN